MTMKLVLGRACDPGAPSMRAPLHRFLLLACLAGCGVDAITGDDAPATGSADDPVTLGGGLAYGPAAVRSSPDSVDVFVAGTDDNVYTRRFTESAKQWSPWQQIESSHLIGSGLAAIDDGGGGVKLFAMNRTSINAQVMTMSMVRSTAGSGWVVTSLWRPAGSYSFFTTDAPAVTRDPAGTLHLFSRDAFTNQLIHTQCTNCTSTDPVWADWTAMGGNFQVYSTPSVISQVTGDFTVYFKGRDARLRKAQFSQGGPPFYLAWWTVTDLNEPNGMWTYTTTSTATADYTAATAVPVDSHQGYHVISNVSTNPWLISNSHATGCNGVGAGVEGVMRLDLPQTARVQIDTAGAGFDTVLYVRKADGVTEVTGLDGEPGCNDDAGGTVTSALDLRLNAGTYYIYLDNYYWNTASVGQQPQVHLSISYYNGPAAVLHGGGTDVYSVNTDNRLYVLTTTALGSAWSLINGPEPVGDGGDYQNTGTLGLAMNAAGTCAHVFGRAYPSIGLLEKGCGEVVSWSLDNYAGAQFSSSWAGPVPNYSANPWNSTWGPVNSAWNQTHDFGVAGTKAGQSALYLSARWPTELYAFDFDDAFADPSQQPWNLFASHGYATLLGYQPPLPGTLTVGTDHGAEVTSKFVTTASGVKAVRLIDHGACSVRLPWIDPQRGVLNSMLGALDGGIYLGMAQALLNAEITGATYTWDQNRIGPSFTHYAWDGTTGIHSDGFAFSTHLRSNFGSSWATVFADAQFTLGLENGIPRIYPLSINGYPDQHLAPDLWIGYTLAKGFNFIAGIAGGLFHPYSDPGSVTNALLDSCAGDDIPCKIAAQIPTMNDAFTSEVTAMIGDPMAAQSCATNADCSGGTVCHNTYCMVPIYAGDPGYSVSNPTSNYRTPWDRQDYGGLTDGHIDQDVSEQASDGSWHPSVGGCTIPAPGDPLSSDDLLHCRLELEGAVAAALHLPLTDPWIDLIASDTQPFQFGCVKPVRPNCGDPRDSAKFSLGAGYTGGYPCRDHDVAPAGTTGAGTGHVSGRCTFHPAFKRLNVTPKYLELVVTEDGQSMSADAVIMNALSPAQACTAPIATEPDISSATPLPLLVQEGPYAPH